MRAQDYITTLLQGHLQGKGFEWPDKANVEPPKDKRFGDMASNVALVLASQAKAKPRAIAEEIREALLGVESELESIEIAGPGFLNFTLKPAFWQQTVGEILKQGDVYGQTGFGNGRKVQVEYVSANPTGPLHIGHGRGAALGDSLTRILRATGHDVSTEYYINDAGRQMRMLGMSVLARASEKTGRDFPFPDDGYKGDYIRDIAEMALQQAPELGTMDEVEAVSLCTRIAVDDILQGIKDDLARFNVEHQVWFSEKSLVASGAVDKTFQLLKDHGLAFEQDGAFWFKTTEFGDDKDRVIRKSDGQLTYFASDIAYHDDKCRRGFQLMVDIWGADHHGYVPRLSAAVEALGYPDVAFKAVLVQLVNLLRGGEPVAMSTRGGTFVTLAEVLDEVGSDAARFMFLSRKSDSHLDFDLDLVKQRSMDNPVYYVQYAHARINSVRRKAVERGISLEALAPESAVLASLSTQEDLDLLKLLARFPETLESAAATLSPHVLSYYLMELAGALHRYYTVHHVLGAEDETLIRARLLLLTATAQVVRNGLGLLGVSAPEQM